MAVLVGLHISTSTFLMVSFVTFGMWETIVARYDGMRSTQLPQPPSTKIRGRREGELVHTKVFPFFCSVWAVFFFYFLGVLHE